VPLYVTWCVIIGIGLLSSATFLTLHRPAHWLRPAAINATGWVVIIGLLYVRSAITLATSFDRLAHKPFWSPDNLIQLVLALAIDALLIFRIYTFVKYRALGTSSPAQPQKSNRSLGSK